MPRFVSFPAVLAAALIVLAGCTGGSGTPTSTVAPSPTTGSAPAGTSEGAGTSTEGSGQPGNVPSPVAQPDSTLGSPVEKPNIVLILTDDQDAASFATMQRTNELIVQQGASVPNFLISLPLCCPSRATILRGQYAHNTHVWGNGPPNGGFETFYERKLMDSTVATWLDDAGYRTALMGKLMNGYPNTADANYSPPGWDVWNAFVDINYMKSTMNENGELVTYGSSAEDYSTDVLSRKAAQFITESQDEPFFLYLSPYGPHGPARPASRHSELFKDVTAPRTAAFDEADVSDKPQWVRDQAKLTPEEIAAVDVTYRNRLATLQSVDEMVANVVATLEETGELDNTYIFVTSDNGYHQGEHRIEKGKQTPYEETARVSMFVRGPGIAPGTSLPQVAANIDLAPTFARLAGVAPGDFVDGRSLVPLLLGIPGTPWRSAVLLEHDDPKNMRKKGDDPKTPGFKAVRSEDTVFIEYTTGEREFYDLKADPHQLDNRISSLSEAEVAALSQAANALSTCAATDCRVADSSP